MGRFTTDPDETDHEAIRAAGWGAMPVKGPNDEPVGIGKFSGEVRTVSDTGAVKGVKPERYDLIPIEPMNLLARLYGVGALKYAEHNWRGGYEWSKSYASAMRHLTLFWNGEDIDEEMRLPHITCATFHLFALAEYLSKPELYGRFDDRYKPAKKSLKDFLIEPKYEYGIEDIELKFPTGFENEETIQKLADVIWESDNHYTDMPWEDAWKLRDHDSFTDLSKHIYRVYNAAKRLVESGWIEQ